MRGLHPPRKQCFTAGCFPAATLQEAAADWGGVPLAKGEGGRLFGDALPGGPSLALAPSQRVYGLPLEPSLSLPVGANPPRRTPVPNAPSGLPQLLPPLRPPCE